MTEKIRHNDSVAGHRPKRPPLGGPFAIVGIGASAGGLEACRKMLGDLPVDSGLAFIVVQHLDPDQASLLADLLAAHTTMAVRQAVEGMAIERDHLYVIPPGTFLAVSGGALRLSQPQARHGSRLPFDFLLYSLAKEYGERALCVVLSGTGADGSLGAVAIKAGGGLVVAQDPAEADYDGMPRSAILTGAVDLILPAAQIPAALIEFNRHLGEDGPADLPPIWLPEIVALLRGGAGRDFSHYKRGTLQRRIGRRMAMASIDPGDGARYLDLLRGNAAELDLLANDFLINVTSFFRDPTVFAFLAEKIIPELIAGRQSDQPLRLWIAGCSTGEETYSLAMLFSEAITSQGNKVKLQIFASDVDADAVAAARDGRYAEAIVDDVSPARLARFFTKEGHWYRVSQELRTTVVFSVQDLLTDPPLSNIDFISCRNLLIYLLPEAQARVISLFHFALRPRGMLLLGKAETIGNVGGLFEEISEAERLYRHIGHSRPRDVGFATGIGGGARSPAGVAKGHVPSRQSALAELCRQMVIETYAPAAVLITHKHECLYSLGPTERYLRMAPGHPTHDLLAMVRQDIRTKLSTAMRRAIQDNAVVAASDGGLRVEVRPAAFEGEDLLLVCFIDEPRPERIRSQMLAPKDVSLVTELERDLDATRAELRDAVRDLEKSSDEQRAINDEALSVNEEYQSTNEELLASKEEMQSFNEELTSLNSQLHEALERQRITSDDLQNVLYSTDVATIFLDLDLNIRFFTPATKALFNVIATDIGRPLADLSPLAADSELLADARKVLKTHVPIDREVEALAGSWFIRRVLPYRTREDDVKGVVITFTDITERRQVAIELESTKRRAELATVAKSRFLAAASHDLRQPLQTLALLQGLLAKTVEGERAKKLVARIDETLGSITAMLNTLLDINHIEAGTIGTEQIDFPVNDLLKRMHDEFIYHAQAQSLVLRVVPCHLSVHSDPRLLEQMIRNLVANALKYTHSGKVLLGCHRRNGTLTIEVWDTGIGIPDVELKAIFEEYHQIDNAARERCLGLGLGLSIVQRLAGLLGHHVSVRSRLGRGSVFAIEVPLSPPDRVVPQPESLPSIGDEKIVVAGQRTGEILVVEDDPEVRGLLEIFLGNEGHITVTAADGYAALELVRRGTARPDLILADYNLPRGMNGLQLATKLCELLGRDVPVIILTGDISTDTLRDIAQRGCLRLNKPVKLAELTQGIQRLLPEPTLPNPRLAGVVAGHSERAVVYIVDDDDTLRDTIRCVLEDDGFVVEDYADCESFLGAYRPGREACLLVDGYLPGMSGVDLLRRLRDLGHKLPAIMITGNSDVPMAVQAMKAGALDFIEKPVRRADLLASIERALEQSRDSGKALAWRADAASHVAGLTARQRQIMELVLAGHPSKNIAADLGISQRTVENHRASIMKKTGSKSLPALARLAVAAG